ncbi:MULTISPECIES: hypothetical protein [Terrabacteria group]|uniref:hypothetical protein n=1 Tax=Bacillati TaxID=1783272 RepID=UPI001C6EE392|nr:MULTISPECIES: hypothetical protein [Terrabacteria group]MBW9212623.1 hypothetical protein [Trueperella sp. zg.1013]
MKTKLGHKITSVFVVLMIALGMLVPSASIVHAAKELEIAKHTSVSGTVSGVTGSNKGTYTGIWTAKVPMADVMAAFEEDMKFQADHGYFPWDKETVSTSASVYYNVTFPENVTIGTPVTNSKSEMFPNSTVTNTVSGQKVSFKFKLIDSNWADILEAYKKDKAAGTENRTIDVAIPYTVKANSKSEAESFDSKKIMGQGNFSFYPSKSWGKWGVGLQTFNSDTSSLPLTKDFAKSDIFKVQEGNVTYTVDLPADLKLGGNTGNQVITKKRDDNMDFEGVINAKTIKEQMANIESQYQAEAQNIKLEKLSTSFTAKLNLPEQLSFTAQNPVLSGANGSFEIESTTLENNAKTAVVKFKLKNANQITNFAQLKEAVNKVEDELKVTFKTAKFNGNAQADTDYEVTGSIAGSLKAKATHTVSNKVINFDLKWNGKQTDEGKSGSNPNAIALSVRYQNPMTGNVTETGKLQGDLLANDDTQHDKVLEFKKSDVFKVTGLLDVSPIKKKIHDLETHYNMAGNASNISVENMKNEFTATMELPEGLQFVNNIEDKVSLVGTNGKFKISEVKLVGKKLTVKLVLTNPVNNFQELKDAVTAVDNQLRVDVNGVTFAPSATKGTNYTIRGNVSGLFSAKATNTVTGNAINFNYKWFGEQLDGGEDFTDLATNDIKLTVKYTKGSEGTYEKTEKLSGDILVGNETEHDKVYEVTKDETVNFMGSLDVSTVKKQLRDIEALYNKTSANPNSIALDNYSSTFTAKLRLPEEMDFVTHPTVTLLNDNGKYKIVDTKFDGKTVTVTMTVTKEVRTFADLRDAVLGMEDRLNVVVSGAKFNAKAKPNTNYTVKGMMQGNLKADALDTVSGSVVHFKLNWLVEQSAEGADFINPTSKAITFTLKYRENPAKPIPGKPSNPNKPKMPSTSDSTNIWMLVGLLGAALVSLGVVFMILKKKDKK